MVLSVSLKGKSLNSDGQTTCEVCLQIMQDVGEADGVGSTEKTDH